jgi:penicillin-binding protein 2
VNFLLQRSVVGEFRRRYRWLVLFVVLVFGALVLRLAQLQIVEGDIHRAQARRNIVRERYLATTRGVIRDANGRVLAANRPSYTVYVTPTKIDLENTWPKVSKLVGLDEAERARFLAKIDDVRTQAKKDAQSREKDRRPEQQLLLKYDVDRDVVAWLETQDPAGVEVAPMPVRYYPYGELGAHLVGYMREVDAEALSRLEERGYRAGDRIGAIGIERRWESYLRGQRGMRKLLRGLRGNMSRESIEALEAKYLEEPRRVEPVPGRDVSLTVDIELEVAIDRAMRGELAGAVAIVDVRTGRLLAALSKPSFDPNVVSGGAGIAAAVDGFRRLIADPLKPMLDKTISAAYPPGSTYKPFTALAGLADGLIDPNTEVDCRGGYEYGKRYFRCTGVHRRVNLQTAIVQSCNTYFYDLASKISIDRLAAIGLD